MVIDHHQLNVFGLIFYTSWHKRSLREKFDFRQNNQNDHDSFQEKKRKDKPIMNITSHHITNTQIPNKD